ncbi:choice-of-anchor L domain-containing protein [Alkalihalobacterium alkalinitrilicum]|uniref:choice-of-anchor L domain-containing protein n=1 Tax=Alkalihalobacterium alkalinitrilicum TaxID=427920 RepID=UPI000994E82F|nr:choice-of-anchor L domain-containing protein [Alkalihalobacterium alkalinitrilicum]
MGKASFNRLIAVMLVVFLSLQHLLPIGTVLAISATDSSVKTEIETEAEALISSEEEVDKKLEEPTPQEIETKEQEVDEETLKKEEQDKIGVQAEKAAEKVDNTEEAETVEKVESVEEVESSLVESSEETETPKRQGTTKRDTGAFSALNNDWMIADLDDLDLSEGQTKAQYLVEALVGSGVVVKNIKYTGVDRSAGFFITEEDIIGFESGIILSTGSVHNVQGPNTVDDISANNGLPGDPDLNSLIPGYTTYDATILEFEFIPTYDEIFFEYVFASDEYNEYVNSSFNDVFGFFVNGQNVATIPGTDTPVAINTVNGGKPYGTNASHPELYRNNDLNDGGGDINTEMDGLTVVLPIRAKVKPNQFNTIKLAIADAGDHILDSNVFIKSGSFIGQAGVMSGLGAKENIKGQQPNYPEKTVGEPVIDPIDSATGAQVLYETLLTVNGAFPLTFDVLYNSLLLDEGMMGTGWTNNYEMSIQESEGGIVNILWDSNRINTFVEMDSGGYTSPDEALKHYNLTKNNDGSFTLEHNNGEKYEFNADGQLVQKYNSYQQVLNYSYNESGQLTSVTEPISGQQLHFSYNNAGLLTTVADNVGREVKFNYDEEELLVAKVDPEQNSIAFTYNEVRQIVTATDSNGKQIFSNTFDEAGRVIAQKDSKNQQGQFEYDEDMEEGRLVTTFTDRKGNQTIFTYNNLYQLLSRTDELGNTKRFEYDSHGNKVKEIDEGGNLTTFSYDDRGNVTSITDALGRTTKMTYDARNNLLSVENAKGDKHSFSYNERNQVTKVTDPQGNSVNLEYDQQGLLTKNTAPKGGTTNFTYHQGLVRTMVDSNGNTTTFEFDQIGQLISYTDPESYTTTFSYNKNGYLTKVTNALGYHIIYSYDQFGNLMQETNSRGNTTKYEYDGNNNLIKETNALNQTIQFNYDAEDLLTSITDARGNTTRFSYDQKGRITGLTNPLDNSITLAYDAVGNIINEKDANGNTVSIANYDSVGNMIELKNALGHTETFEYDNVDLLKKITTEQGTLLNIDYDAIGRAVRSVDALSGVSQQGFDSEGNQTSLTDANGNTLQFAFNLLGDLTSVESANGHTIHYEYDNRGLISKMTNGRGQETTYEYDPLGRVITLVEPENTSHYTYDENNNILTITDNLGTISYVYDAFDRIIKYTDVYGNIIQYGYDANHNITKLTYPNGNDVHYSYDSANQLVEVRDWKDRTTRYSYDENGRLLETSRPNGTVETRTYNELGQLIATQDVSSSGEVINHYQYTYDEVGNIVSEQNEISMNIDIVPSSITASYSSGNQVNTMNDHTMIHDEDGNLTTGVLQGGQAEFEYDSRNRLVSTGHTEYTYDINDQRVALTEGGETTKYVVNPIAHLSQVLMETDSEGNLLNSYIYGIGLIGFEDEQFDYFTYHQDYRGSTTAITDEEATVVARYMYDPFGNIIAKEGNVDQPYLYTGQYGVETDHNGLLFMRARYYQPETQRFLNEDIVKGSVLLGQSYNRYAYSRNNPVMFVDPDGEWAHIAIGAGIGAIVGGVTAAIAGDGIKDVVAGTLGGAVAGGITAAAAPVALGAGLVGGTAITVTSGAGAGIAGELTSSLVKWEKPKGSDIATAALLGAIPIKTGTSKYLQNTNTGLKNLQKGLNNAQYGLSKQAQANVAKQKKSLNNQLKVAKGLDNWAPDVFTHVTGWALKGGTAKGIK